MLRKHSIFYEITFRKYIQIIIEFKKVSQGQRKHVSLKVLQISFSFLNIHAFVL